MNSIKNASSIARMPDTIPPRIWREVGLLLLTLALLFLPWFKDPSPPLGRSPLVTGMELIRYGTWLVPLAYSLALTAYILSTFSRSKWAGIIPFIGSLLVYFNIFINTYYTRFDPPGIPLDRWNGLVDKHFTLGAGMWFNWIGLLALLAGLYCAEEGRRRMAILFGVVGTFAGIIFYLILSLIGLLKPEPYILTSVQAYAFQLIGTIVGSWLVLRKNSVIRDN